MNSNFGQDIESILKGLQEQLEAYEKGYDEFEKERINPADLGTEIPESLLKATDLVTEYSNEYTKVYGLIEEMISVYEGIVGMFNTELIDGRIVDDVLADFEDSLGKVDTFIGEFQRGEDKMVELSETITGIYDNLEPKETIKLTQAKIMNDLEKK